MPRGSLQRGYLVFDREHVLHGPEGNHDQREFLVEAKTSHVAFMHADSLTNFQRLTRQVLIQHLQHWLRVVDSASLNALPRDGQRDAAGAAGDFQDRAAVLLREFQIKRQIDQILLGSVGAIVVLRDDVVGVDCGHAGLPAIEY